MSKEDANNTTSSSNSGLLSKMVRFVRNPSSHWSVIDSPSSESEERESQYSKQVLKEMIERKRRNDFVRRREFAQLRKLRQQSSMQGQSVEQIVAHNTSSFMDSGPSSAAENGRADTLKKIDKIEAEMAQQWWKAKPAPATPAPHEHEHRHDHTHTHEHGHEHAPEQEHAHQRAASDDRLSVTAEALAAVRAGLPDNMSFAATVPMGMEPAAAAQPAAAPPHVVDMLAPQPPPVAEKFVHEPDLEEAAIRFANADYAGAETDLVDVLKQHQHDDPLKQHELWMTLFDLYRATGQKERFDSLSISYAERFGRSAPLWFSMPEQLGMPSLLGPDARPVGQRELLWNAPAMLAQQSVTALQASVARSAPPWTLNWTRTKDIEPPAVTALADLFEGWANQKVQLRFLGAQEFQVLLQGRTHSGSAEADPQWWRLRMATLRLMGQADEFELVALEFCVTYEVSPPSWEPPQCSYSGDDGTQGGPEAQPQKGPESVPMSSYMQSVISQPVIVEEPAHAELTGHIEGDATPLLTPLEATISAGQPLIVDCERLIRIDFAAIGSVLNWAAERQAEGHAMQFIHLHRLVAVFFNVIGINEHARVVPREN